MKRTGREILPVQNRRHRRCLELVNCIRSLALGRGIVDSAGSCTAVQSVTPFSHNISDSIQCTFRTTPIPLSNIKPTANGFGIHLASLLVHNLLLRLNDGARLALVVHAHDLGAQLELAALAGDGQGLEKGHFALAVDDAAVVEFGDVGDGVCVFVAEEVDDFLVGEFEGCGDVRLPNCLNRRTRIESACRRDSIYYVRRIIG